MKKIFYTFILISPLLFISSCEEEEETQSGYNCVSSTCIAVFESPQYLTLSDCQSSCADNNNGDGSNNSFVFSEESIANTVWRCNVPGETNYAQFDGYSNDVQHITVSFFSSSECEISIKYWGSQNLNTEELDFMIEGNNIVMPFTNDVIFSFSGAQMTWTQFETEVDDYLEHYFTLQ